MVKTYYWNARQNFGDLLTPLLLKRFTGLDSELTTPENAQLIMAGSAIDKLPEDWSGVLAGTGKLHETPQKLPNAKILALRGFHTARAIGRKAEVYADAGLLANELVPIEDKIYDLGIVPHWTDKKLEHNPTFLKYDPLIIRANNDPLRVIQQIGQCKKIVSSSLHGIILADAFQIPRRIEIAPWFIERPKQEGGMFKWVDYSSSLGVKLEIGITQEMDRHMILEKQYELYDVFKDVKEIFKVG